MTHELDPARTQLLARFLSIPRFREQDETFLVRRLSQMTDRQVTTVLATSDEELEEQREAARGPQYAPATDSAPVTFWYHGTLG
ncbi:hypothetical protein ACFWVF_32670 [Streptomyces sp. NPDC058659]|uniref:hypothetical protein n=1 Tax=unclassified Streptomyces TaxID=2593676 RepID=UPI0036579207